MDLNLVISLTGAVCLLSAYIAVQEKYLNSESYTSALLNFVGGILLAISAFSPLNLGIFIVETFWALVSLKMIVRLLRSGSSSKT